MTKKFVGSFDESCLPNLEEFDKRYSKSWVYIKYKAIEGFFRYVRTAYAGNELVLVFWNPEIGNLFVNEITDFSIDVVIPEVGYFNSNKCAYIFERKPARQWKRGLNVGDNFNVYSPIFDYISVSIIPVYNCRDSYYYLLKDALKKNFVPLDKAVALCLESEVASVAVDPLFALSPSFHKKEAVAYLYLKRNMIGYVDPNNTTVSVHSIYLPETMDLLRGTSWKLNSLTF